MLPKVPRHESDPSGEQKDGVKNPSRDVRRTGGDLQTADHGYGRKETEDMERDDEDEPQMPRQEKEPVGTVALEVFPHVEIVFQGVEQASPGVSGPRFGPPFLLFIVGAAVTVVFLVDHGVEIPPDMGRHFQPGRYFYRIDDDDKQVCDIRQTDDQRSHEFLFSRARFLLDASRRLRKAGELASPLGRSGGEERIDPF